MKTAALCLVVALLVLSGTAAAGTLRMMTEDELGAYLAAPDGRTLYYFKKDSPGTSMCSGTCIENWPVFFVEDAKAPEGIDQGDFGSIKREDGRAQSTFRGYPLYYYKWDSKAGDIKGHSMGNVWSVVKPDRFMK